MTTTTYKELLSAIESADRVAIELNETMFLRVDKRDLLACLNCDEFDPTDPAPLELSERYDNHPGNQTCQYVALIPG